MAQMTRQRPPLWLFDDLPLGARFTYQGSSRPWVKLENGGRALIAEWSIDAPPPRLGQSICTLADNEREREKMKVRWLDIA